MYLSDRHPKASRPKVAAIRTGSVTYGVVIVAILVLSISWSRVNPRSDFAQDFLAARSAGEGRDPNAATRDLARIYGVPDQAVTSRQNAHPPLVILLASPFSVFPWHTAHLLWELALCAAVGILMLAARIRLFDLVFLAPVWIFGLALGNVDALVVCLCLVAIPAPHRTRTGIALGIAAALKVYPLLLLAGLLATRHYRAFSTGLLTGAGLTLLATWVLGTEALTGWLAYIPGNGNFFAQYTFNISLSKAAVVLGGTSYHMLLVGLVMLCLQLRRGSVEPLLAGMLLVAPLTWLQQLPLLSNRLCAAELLGISTCSILILLSQYFPLPKAGLIGPLASLVLTGLVVAVYARLIIRQGAGREAGCR